MAALALKQIIERAVRLIHTDPHAAERIITEALKQAERDGL
jgi:hypothetical protein